MDNPRQPNLEARESGEKPESVERQKMDDATFEPEAYVEGTADYRQAESIQTTMVALVGSTAAARDAGATPQPIPRPEDTSVLGGRPTIRGDLDQATVGGDDGRHDATPITLPGQEGPVSATPITLPQMRVQPEEAEEEGHPPEPPDLDHNPHPEAMMKAPESGTLRSRMPKIRDDLDQAKPAGSQEGGKSDATPINLPGPESAAAGPALIPENDIRPDARSGGQADSLPLPIPSPKSGISGETADPSGAKPFERRKQAGEYFSENEESPHGATHQDAVSGDE